LNYVFLQNDTISKIFQYLFLVNFLIYSLVSTYAFNLVEPIHGRFSSSVEFFEDKVVVAGSEISLSEIKIIRLVLGHYHKQKDNRNHFSVYPRLYNGNDNFVEVEKMDRSKVQAYFHIAGEGEFDEKMSELLRQYKSQGKFLFLG
jgi:hypothetical protein